MLIPMANRKRVPPDVESCVLSRSARRCCLCFHLKQDFTEKLGQLAHLDHDPSNSTEDNLAFLCMDHHSLYDSRTSQHKNHTIGEVKGARAKLYAEIERRKPAEWLLVLDGSFSEMDKARVEAVVDHLRKMLADPHLTIKRADPGSINLLIESDGESFEKMKRLVESQEVTEILGFPIKKVTGLEDAFNDLWKNNWTNVVRYLRRILPSESDTAEDAALMAFTRAWQNRDLSIAHLMRSARNIATPLYRRSMPELADSPEIEVAHPVSPEELVLHEERLEQIRSALTNLTPRERAIITLVLNDFSSNDIAEAMDMPRGTVAILIHRARQRLRQMLLKPREE
jgi:RNA polymerase sigma factor (sigma-70 family)